MHLTDHVLLKRLGGQRQSLDFALNSTHLLKFPFNLILLCLSLLLFGGKIPPFCAGLPTNVTFLQYCQALGHYFDEFGSLWEPPCISATYTYISKPSSFTSPCNSSSLLFCS